MEIKGKYNTLHFMGSPLVDEETIRQAYTMANCPAINGYTAIMPDCHAGAGSMIGFTMQLHGRVIPNVVGVDIGCGVLVGHVPTRPMLPPSRIDENVRRVIPTGHGTRTELDKLTRLSREEMAYELELPADSYGTVFKRVGIAADYALASIGTLGGGKPIATG